MVAALLLLDAFAPTCSKLTCCKASCLPLLCRHAGLVRAGGVPRLLRLLSSRGTGAGAHVNAAGALQTMSYQPDGRTALLKADGAATVLAILKEGMAGARSWAEQD